MKKTKIITSLGPSSYNGDMFEQMVEDIRTDVVKILLNVHKAGDTRRKQTVEITKASQENLNNLDNYIYLYDFP